MSTSDRLPEGKVPWDLIADRVRGVLPAEVLVGPGAGEDAALVRIGGEIWAAAADPISFTATDAGRLAVLVNANDVAVTGAKPTLFVAVVLVAPEEASAERVEALLDQIRVTCDQLDITLIGGHTEVTPGISHSLVVGTMLGPVTDRPITTGGLRAGDWIGMTKWAGLEGTAILLSELGARLDAIHGPTAFRKPEEIFPGEWLSVVPEACVAAACPGVSALHDVTEGGVGEALFELGRASGLDLEVRPEDIPILPETELLCRDLDLNPLGLIGSGALLIGCSAGRRDELAAACAAGDIPFTWIGRAVAPGTLLQRSVPRFERDEILRIRFLEGIQACIFDLDGTLVDADYDWIAIRRTLGVGRAPIIEFLNGLESPEREARWETLRGIEHKATRTARAKPGVRELLGFLQQRGIRTALVTNNSAENTRFLLDRFQLEFDVVLTRDSGLWKPSGAPIAEAARRLGLPPDRCVAVGDSRYDLAAAREAGCARVCILHANPPAEVADADLRFPDVGAFLCYLRLVL